MVLGDTYHADAAQKLSDRLRTMAAWTGGAGLALNVIAFIGFLIVGDVTPILISEVLIYGLVLGLITFSAFRNQHVRQVLYSGLLAIFAVFWLSNFAEAIANGVSAFDLPLAIFIPVFLVLILDHRRLLLLAPVQFACIYYYVSSFGAVGYSASWTRQDEILFGLLLAAFSGFMFVALGIVAYARERADRNLFKLIVESEKLAATDGLTGLMNRRAFIEDLRRTWSRRSRICIAFIDLDHFKPLNDQYGHAVGDLILQTVADRIAQTPLISTTARLGGDEFAVLFDADINNQTFEQLIELLHTSITADIYSDAGPIAVGASIGLASGNTMKQTLSGLMRSADTAMRRAKSNRLGWAVFNPQIDSAALVTSTLELELKSAIKTGQIKAAIQPIANAKTRKVEAYELLARWTDSGFDRDPTPKDFIPIAEKLGLLNEILWVTMDEALEHLDLTDLRLAINVSPAQLLASDFLETLLSLLDRHQVGASSITIEITEEVAFRNLERNIVVLEQARALGMTIALDDFGTGYSSLSMLDTLPLDKLKIDQSFVLKSDKSEQSKSILLAAIRLARQLGLESCVEGIETQTFAARVAVLGADTIQGYWIGRPLLVRDELKRVRLAS